jgi:hypothetical protein
MISSEVQRTLVKSPPELWAELSDPSALTRHLGELGEIRITRVDPEQMVAWEAADTSGTVLIKPSGWGTKVTLTATRQIPAPAPVVEAEPEPVVEPVVVVEPEPEPRRGFFARIFGRRRKVELTSEPEPQAREEDQPDISAEPQAAEEAPEEIPDISAELKAAEEVAAEEVTAVLTSVLDRLGAAHHRPFSRA